MKKIQMSRILLLVWILPALGIALLVLSTADAIAQTSAELELVSEVPSLGGIEIQRIQAIHVLNSDPNEIVFITQNQGSYCGGGTPASVWKLTLDPNTGDVISLLLKQSLSLIQEVRGTLFESSDGTLFTGGGWCGYKPPYYSKDNGETWQPANVGVHPPNSTYSFAEFNGEVYAGTGYHPWHGQIYRWLGDAGTDYWELLLDVDPPRSIMRTMVVYENQLFVGSLVYWPGGSGCETSVPVYVSSDGNTFNATTGIPPCYSVRDLLVVGDQLVARVFNFFDTTEYYLYRWNNSSQEWVAIGASPLNWAQSLPGLVAHDGVIYSYGQAPGDTSAGIYQSADLGQTWQQIDVLQDPEASAMTIHDGMLYIGTYHDADNTAYIYKMQVSMPTPTAVALDVKPRSCPNPLNVKSRGKLPVAILGTDAFDVEQIDPASVRLEGVAPLRWALEDVTTPYEPFVGKEGAHDCTTMGPDEYRDLNLKFDTQEIVAALGEVRDRDVRVLALTGNLKEEFAGTPIVGEDVVVILKKGKK